MSATISWDVYYNPETQEHEYVAFQFLSLLLPTVGGAGRVVDNDRCWPIEWAAAYFRFCRATGAICSLTSTCIMHSRWRTTAIPETQGPPLEIEASFFNVDDLTINGLGFSASRPPKKRKFDLINCIRELLKHKIISLDRLLKAAREGATLCGLTGAERESLYLTAAYTGLRCRELGSLTESSFDLTANPPTMTVEAGDSKRRRRDTLPVQPLLAETLAKWFAQRLRQRASAPIALKFDAARKKSPNERRGTTQNAEPLWPGRWAKYRHGAEMVRHDLQAAGLPFEDERDDVFDFHSLRGQFITQLGRSGVSLVETQKLARHCDPKLTANHYTHLSLHDLISAVSRLAAPRTPDQERETMKATGTENPARFLLAHPLAQTWPKKLGNVEKP